MAVQTRELSSRVWCRNCRYTFTYTRNTPFANSRLSPGELLLVFILYADTLLSINQIAQLVDPCYDTIHSRLRKGEAAFERGFLLVFDRIQHTELAETGETFRRIVFEDVDGEEIAYLTTLSPENYDPVDVMNIYTLRTLIEILFRELKQYTNIETVHSQSVNGVLFEMFCALIGYVLIEWFRHCHPLPGGVPEAIRTVRTRWNQSLPSCG